MASVEVKEMLDTRDIGVRNLLMSAREIKEKSADFTVTKANENNVYMGRYGGLNFYPDTGKRQSMFMSRYALGQLCGKIGVPANYVDKCLNSGREELAQDNINSWLIDFNKDLFIRSYNDHIRGILSTRYSVCDSDEILECVDSILNLDNFNVKGSYLSPERFHLRIALKEKMNVPNEDLFAGLAIDSSDVGRSVLQVRFLVFKQVCTNGLIVSKSSNKLFKQKHIGITSEEFAEGLEESIEIFPQLIEGVEDIIKSAIEDKMSPFVNLTDEAMEELVERISKTAHITDDDAKNVISIMQSGRYDYNRWGYINALTEVARDMTLEKRLEVEEYAGSLLVA